LKTGYKYADAGIEGYYLQDFGAGIIMADTEMAGLELLKFRLSLDSGTIVVPETNSIAIDYITSFGFYQSSKTSRVFLNKNLNWDSRKIFARGCGYLG
jgi:hypothetical protein